MPTHTERDEHRASWAATHKPSRLEAAEDRGYEPGYSDPTPQHLIDPDSPWEQALQLSVKEVEAIRERALLAEERDREWWS